MALIVGTAPNPRDGRFARSPVQTGRPFAASGQSKNLNCRCTRMHADTGMPRAIRAGLAHISNRLRAIGLLKPSACTGAYLRFKFLPRQSHRTLGAMQARLPRVVGRGLRVGRRGSAGDPRPDRITRPAGRLYGRAPRNPLCRPAGTRYGWRRQARGH